MLPTPSTSHVDLDRIYEPAEDSYLLLDTLSSATEVHFLGQRLGAKSKNNPSPVVLEVGTGSGVILAFVTAHAEAIFGRGDVLTIGTDVNQFACQATERTVSQACQQATGAAVGPSNRSRSACMLATIGADLTAPLRAGAVDVLIFNPPYVPSFEVPESALYGDEPRIRSFEHDSHLLSISYEGGKDGVEVTDRLLEQLPNALNAERGVAYILLCQQNRPEEVIKRIQGWEEGWSVTVVGHSGKKAGWEKLQIIRICRN
ncbi:S-adenosylmethionine-dependent methyltransferase [Mycoblastus sanguinarius]|nr:S-adenosylmethionine-dependent methyltransferase [Mycoblastus sanguinarius]